MRRVPVGPDYHAVFRLNRGSARAGGNVGGGLRGRRDRGSQALAVAVRGIASGEVERKSLYRLIYREAVVGLLTGVVLGLIGGSVAATGLFNPRPVIVHHLYAVGVVLALTMTLNHLFACLVGVGIPLAIKRLGLDPAQSAIIWTTAATDCFGFLTLLALATAFMSRLT